MKRRSVFPLLLVLAVAGLLSFTTARPRLFVIGDSISIFYGPYLKKYVEGKFDYDRKRDKGEAMKNLDNPVGANGGDSRMVLSYLKELSADPSFKADVLLLNCGLHDVKTDPKTGKLKLSRKALLPKPEGWVERERRPREERGERRGHRERRQEDKRD